MPTSDAKSTAVPESKRVEYHINKATMFLHSSKLPEAEEFTAMIKGLFKNRNKRLEVLKYYRYLSSDDKSAAKKGAHK